MLQAKLEYINLYQCESGFTTKERFFTFPYLLYVHSGQGQFKIGPTTYAGNMGDLFFCPAGTGNTIIADRSEPFLLTGIDFRATDGQPETEPPPPLPSSGAGLDALRPQINILANVFLVGLINRMVSEYQLGRVFAQDICSALLAALLIDLMRDAQTVQAAMDNIQLAMLDYLQKNSGRTVTGAEMASTFAYHRSSINRILIAASGMSLREYQIAARIRMAAELLSYSNRPLSEIAALCGYGSPIFFARQFQEKTGQSPSKYRQSRLP